MPTPSIGGVPFQEAIDHFRGKLDIPTPSFDAMLGEIHAKAFTVAGAVKLDLLTDLRSAVDDAIAKGTSIHDFRQQFDAAVQKHGWSYKGKRGWRTRVIYDTNMRTAHMAGRWQQFQRTKDTRPFLEYQTAGDKRVRPQHAAWDHTLLNIDDPWWRTHMPPNGWQCRCTVRSMSPRQMKRDQLVPTDAPPVKKTERVNTRTGEVYGEVPAGIDVGFDYNVGKAWLGPETSFGEKLALLPPNLRTAALSSKNLQTQAKRVMPSFKAWASDVLASDQHGGEIRALGYMTDVTIEAAAARGHVVHDATLSIDAEDLRNMAAAASPVPGSELLKLPTHIAAPSAVLWDKSAKSIVYVFNDSTKKDQTSRLFAQVEFRKKGELTNSIRSAGRAKLADLKDTSQFDVIDGEL